MPKYCKKPVIVEATQWWELGDHPYVVLFERDSANTICQYCSYPLKVHGRCLTLEGWFIVCPGMRASSKLCWPTLNRHIWG